MTKTFLPHPAPKFLANPDPPKTLGLPRLNLPQQRVSPHLLSTLARMVQGAQAGGFALFHSPGCLGWLHHPESWFLQVTSLMELKLTPSEKLPSILSLTLLDRTLWISTVLKITLLLGKSPSSAYGRTRNPWPEKTRYPCSPRTFSSLFITQSLDIVFLPSQGHRKEGHQFAASERPSWVRWYWSCFLIVTPCHRWFLGGSYKAWMIHVAWDEEEKAPWEENPGFLLRTLLLSSKLSNL